MIPQTEPQTISGMLHKKIAVCAASNAFIGRRGLSTACTEGMLASSAPFLAIIDGDLQHDETLLGPMLDTLKSDDLDIVVGSRYIGRWCWRLGSIAHKN